MEGPDALPRGRALDLGCGHGRHSIYLARQGWDVTGIDIVATAVATARAKAAEAGVSPRLIAGDVTELTQLGVTGGHSLIVDAGCFHGLPSRIRQRYVTAVTGAASPGATLLMLGLARHPVIKGVTADELRQRFRGWELVRAVSVAGDEMLLYGDAPRCCAGRSRRAGSIPGATNSAGPDAGCGTRGTAWAEGRRYRWAAVTQARAATYAASAPTPPISDEDMADWNGRPTK
ncbi:class I SAM-dependent methyltransferase [Salinispora arenicola]|uniref:class I SAM-dependent methyltransferase n=1 Tax=Salinispora arenicola TaxID=168697 RepID=UPI0027DD4A07|nr:methyltransferase domain-containing protein [Salinispora arenicola]